MNWRALICASLLCAASDVAANGFRILEGHGGPVMGLRAEGDTVLTASFDNSVGVWNGDAGPVWLDGHEAAVKTVIFVGDDRIASAGDDKLILIWNRATGALLHRLEGHTAKVMSLAASPDGALLASASWDRRVGIWDARTGAHIRWIEGHSGIVNDVVFADATTLFSASYDGTVREWRLPEATQVRMLARHGFGVNTLLLDPARRWLAYGALDGGTRALRLSDGAELADMTLDRRPILSMAQRSDGSQIAVGDGEGHIMVVDTDTWAIRHDFRAARKGPIWALAYVDGGSGVAAGGIEDRAYIWPLEDLGDQPRMAEETRAFHTDPSTVGNGERQFLRKCSVCHTLTPDGGRKAGPSLFGLFGRQAGTLDGYSYSEALDRSTLVWSEETIDKLFELGPDHFTPGSKMPMQQIARPEDRADLIAFLKERTARGAGKAD